MSELDKALERAGGSPRLAQVLLSVVRQFITPREDRVYDWQIVPLSRLRATRIVGQHTWEAELPEEIRTARWSAPVRQCALVWGTRIAPSRFHDEQTQPTPVAVLVRAVQDPSGEIRAEIGATFLYSTGSERSGPTWFAQRGSGLDPLVQSLIVGYLNRNHTGAARCTDGVDLD